MNDVEEKQIIEYGNAIEHRGPDNRSHITERLFGRTIIMDHFRLSIVDLTDAANQPLTSHTKRFVMIFNGEVYNHRELRQQPKLQNRLFTTSDTEVLVNLIELEGIDAALGKLNWMGAFSVLDRKLGKIYCARDFLGEKPLYYYEGVKDLFFSSEIKVLRRYKNANINDLNYDTLSSFLWEGLYSHNSDTMYTEIKQVESGSYIEIDLKSGEKKTKKYSPLLCDLEIKKMNYAEKCEYFRLLFKKSVNERLDCDADYGVLLSGGLDSSSILSQIRSERPNDQITTLSAVSRISQFSEDKFIEIANKEFNGSAVFVSGDNNTSLSDILIKLNYYNDTPVPSYSNILHFSLTRQANLLGKKVLFSGQGADEFFLGYRKYAYLYLMQLFKGREFVKSAKTALELSRNFGLVKNFNFVQAQRYLKNNHQLNYLLNKDTKNISLSGGAQSVRDVQLRDINSTSVPLLCHTEDRFGMANGVEIRLPFLDTRIMDFALKVDLADNFRGGYSKSIVRDALVNSLPECIRNRKDKQGFVNPEEHYIRTQLADLLREATCVGSPLDKLGFLGSNASDVANKYLAGGRTNIWSRVYFRLITTHLWLSETS